MKITTKKKLVVIRIFTILAMIMMLYTDINTVIATGIGTAEVTQATDNIKRVITSIAMPLGGVLIFASIVIAAIKMIANANNPQKRAESIGSLAWICGGGIILGLSLIIAGIIINIATNNTRKLAKLMEVCYESF